MFSASSILGNNFGAVTAALDGLTMRQKVHSENLANIDTEGYQAKTVDFERQLSSAMQTANSHKASPMMADGAGLPNTMSDAMTGGMLFDGMGNGGANKFSKPGFRSSVMPGGGGVNRIQETNQMMADMVRFRFLSQNVTNRLSGLRSVLSEMGRA